MDPQHELSPLIAELSGGPPARILVCGDVMLDEYVWGSVDRISPEAPVVVLREERRESRLGGAASVAALLHGLGARVELVGVVGADAEGRALRHLASERAIGTSGLLVDPERATSVKRRFLGRAEQRHPQQMLRVDRESTTHIGSALAEDLAHQIAEKMTGVDAVLVADYGKGLLNAQFPARLIDDCRKQSVPVAVDPARGAEWSRYRGATLIKANRRELELVAGTPLHSLPDIGQVASVLRVRHACQTVLVTLDRDGLLLVDELGALHMPTSPRDVYDVTGAGDMVLAMLGIGLARGIPPRAAAWLANRAAGLEVEHWGVTPVTWDDLRRDLDPAHDKILSLTDLLPRLAEARRQGRSIVLTNGCFDLLHEGHVACLRGAAARGDLLVVAVNSDASVRRLKGAGRPILTASERAAVLAALADVDYVTVFDEDTPHYLLQRIRPDVLVKGGTYAAEQVVGREIVESYGGQVRVVPPRDGRSTTTIIERCAAHRGPGPPTALEKRPRTVNSDTLA